GACLRCPQLTPPHPPAACSSKTPSSAAFSIWAGPQWPITSAYWSGCADGPLNRGRKGCSISIDIFARFCLGQSDPEQDRGRGCGGGQNQKSGNMAEPFENKTGRAGADRARNRADSAE